MQFEWPNDLEECVYDLARAHVRGGLKRRTWEALHAELLAKIPPSAPKRCSLQDVPRVYRAAHAVELPDIDYRNSMIGIIRWLDAAMW